MDDATIRRYLSVSRLANMQWIERSDGEWMVTSLGLHARDLASAVV